MSKCLALIGCIVAVTAVAALCAPGARSLSHPHPRPSMESPQYLELGAENLGFQNNEDNAGVEPGEPVTQASGSVCRKAGYVDPQAFEVQEIGIDWTLKLTDWFTFTGTGGPVVVRVNGSWFYGAVLYQAEDIPTAYDALACGASPPRFEIDTEAGRRY